MQRPYKFTVIDNKTGEVVLETNTSPLLHHLQTWEPHPTEPNVRVLQQTKTCYEDMRYAAKLRLWKYVEYTRNGLPVPRYRPFDGTDIGRSVPILNF